jgi:glycosyltransferase involved in cell wall biosynthesis
MMASPLVSVLTAAYRSDATHLRAALQSALGQSCTDFEVVVSDDSPDDRLRDLVESLGDSRIRYRINTPPLGVADNHARCLRDARGEYVVLLNHDDTLEPTFLEQLMAPLQADGSLALAFCDHWIINARGERNAAETDAASRRYGRAHLAPGAHRPFFRLLLNQTIPMAMGTMFRRLALVDSMPPQAGPAYDLWLAYLLCRHGMGAFYVRERLSSWRSHPTNLTSAGDIRLLDGAASCWAAVARDPAMSSVRKSARVRESRAYYACSRWHRRHRATGQSLSYAWRSLRTDVNWRALALCARNLLPWEPRSAIR